MTFLHTPANDSLVSAIEEAGRRLGHGQIYGIAIIPEGDDLFRLTLVDTSSGRGSLLDSLTSVLNVRREDVPDTIRHIKTELPQSAQNPEGVELPVFLSDRHEGEHRRCWRSVDATLLPGEIGESVIAVSYNPTIC